MKPQSSGSPFFPPLKSFLILNGKHLSIKHFESLEQAVEWSENNCDQSLEIIVREFENTVI